MEPQPTNLNPPEITPTEPTPSAHKKSALYILSVGLNILWGVWLIVTTMPIVAANIMGFYGFAEPGVLQSMGFFPAVFGIILMLLMCGLPVYPVVAIILSFRYRKTGAVGRSIAIQALPFAFVAAIFVIIMIGGLFG